MADFDDLGKVDIDGTEALFASAEHGRKAADEAALAVLQYGADIEWALKHIAVAEGKAERKARRVARHAKRAAEQLLAVRESMKKIPAEFMRTYEPELTAIRNKDRRRFDISKGA